MNQQIIMPKRPSETCEVEAKIAIIAGKWKPIILFNLRLGALRFSDIKRALPKTSDRMLIRSLRELEEDNLISREVFKEVPARVEYELTVRGKSLLPVLDVMSKWAATEHGIA